MFFVGMCVKGYIYIWPYIDGVPLKPLLTVPIGYFLLTSATTISYTSLKSYFREIWVHILGALGLWGAIGFITLEGKMGPGK